METVTFCLSTSSVERLSQAARDCGLKKGTLTRLVIERWLRDSDPTQLFEHPEQRDQERTA